MNKRAGRTTSSTRNENEITFSGIERNLLSKSTAKEKTKGKSVFGVHLFSCSLCSSSARGARGAIEWSGCSPHARRRSDETARKEAAQWRGENAIEARARRDGLIRRFGTSLRVPLTWSASACVLGTASTEHTRRTSLNTKRRAVKRVCSPSADRRAIINQQISGAFASSFGNPFVFVDEMGQRLSASWLPSHFALSLSLAPSPRRPV